MQFPQFETLFGVLGKIEEALKKEPEPQQREVLINSILDLRNTMDQCVKYWLQFENKLNEMQAQYDFQLPDLLPDGFLELEKEFLDEENLNKLTGEKIEEKSTPLKMESIFSLLCENEDESLISFRKGLGFWDLSMLQEAIGEFEKVVKQEPNFIFGHFCLGFAYLDKGEHDQALQKLRLVKSLSHDPQIISLVHNAIGSIYAREKKFHQALDEYSKSLEEDPGNYMAQFNLGVSYLYLKQFQKAIEIFSRMQDTYSEDWEILYLLGRSYSLSGEYLKGLDSLKKAFNINPSETKILFEMGILYELIGDPVNANNCFGKIINR